MLLAAQALEMNESTKDAWLGIGAAHHTKERRVSCDTSVPSASRIRAAGQNHFHAPCKQLHSHAVRACACARVRLRGLVLVHLFAPARVGADKFPCSVARCARAVLSHAARSISRSERLHRCISCHHVAPCCSMLHVAWYLLRVASCMLHATAEKAGVLYPLPTLPSHAACWMLDVACRMLQARSACMFMQEQITTAIDAYTRAFVLDPLCA
jgi:hypothetical protein